MRSILNRTVGLLMLLGCVAGIAAQTMINPVSQIRWPVAAGVVDPVTPTQACGTFNYGQPYSNVSSGKLFICTIAGWTQVTSSGGASFPVTSSLVWNTSTSTSRNATLTDITSFWTTSGTGCGTSTNVPLLNGTCVPPGTCPTGVCIITAPTGTQTVAQPGETALSPTQSWDTLSDPSGSGAPSSVLLNPKFKLSGPGKNYGNYPVFGNLWRVGVALPIYIDSRISGILEGIKIDSEFGGDNCLKCGTGDWSGVRIGDGQGNLAGGWVDVSGEAITPFINDGTQIQHPFIGHVVSGSFGSTNPVIAHDSGTNSVINDGWLIDTHTAVVSGILAGRSVPWESSIFGLLPTSAVNSPTTSICTTTALIAPSTILQVPQTQTTVACNVGALTTGGAGIPFPTSCTTLAPCYAIIGGLIPEPVEVTGATNGSGGTQNLTFVGARPHEVGATFFAGGTQGINIFTEEQTLAGDITDIIVLGATDSTHQIIEVRSAAVTNSFGVPWLNSMAQSTTGAFNVYPACLIYTLAQDGVTLTCTANTASWTAGDQVISPPPTSYVEVVYTATSTQTSPTNPANGGGFFQAFNNKSSANGQHPAFAYNSTVPASHYTDFGGWLTAPPLLAQTGFGAGSEGPPGTWIQADTPLHGSVCAGRPTYFCDVNSNNYTGEANFYENSRLAGSQFSVNGGLARWLFNWGVASNSYFSVTGGLGHDVFNTVPSFTNSGFTGASGVLIDWTTVASGAAGRWRYGVESFTPTIIACWYLTTEASNAVQMKICSDNVGGSKTVDFLGAVSTPSASVLASTVLNDFASYDNTTGHLADSGVLIGSIPFLNVANQFGNFTQSFGLSGSGTTQISNVGVTGVNAALATTYAFNNSTGDGSLHDLTVNSCTGCGGGGSTVIKTTTTQTVPTTAVCTNNTFTFTGLTSSMAIYGSTTGPVPGSSGPGLYTFYYVSPGVGGISVCGVVGGSGPSITWNVGAF